MEWLSMERWSPYLVGIGIGMLSGITFLLSDKPIGCSTAFTRTSGMIAKYLLGPSVHEKPYYKKFVPEIDWEWMLVFGIFIGAFLSASLSGTIRPTWVPMKWSETFGHTPVLRWMVALLGGLILGLGARWAGGCTSGHGISGTLQLAVSSWLAVLSFFIGGIATALFIYHLL